MEPCSLDHVTNSMSLLSIWCFFQTEFTNTAISDFGILGYKILICHSNVLFSFCFSLKSCCFCLQGTHHTFHEQKAREKVKMSQKMWKIWAKWSENQHNSNENKRWAEPRGQQSITPKKASGARDPIFGRMLVFYHPLKTPNSKNTDYSLNTSQQHRCSTEIWKENLIHHPDENRENILSLFSSQEEEEMPLGDLNMCSKLSN